MCSTFEQIFFLNKSVYFLVTLCTCEVTYLLNRYITSCADNKIQIQLQTDFDHLLPQSLTWVCIWQKTIDKR